MKVLMIGLGSIGQRHLRNLKRLYGDNVEILAYRVRGLQQTFSDDMKIRQNISLDEEYNIKVFRDLDEALNEKPEVAFITNVTSKHVECAIKAAKAGCNIFLEKPISDNMNQVEELGNAIRENEVICYVGYQNRKHVCIKRAKEILEEKIIGDLISVHTEFSERLATMHTYEDYSGTYMARADLGGGAILNLQIHDLDLIQWLFGKPEAAYAVSGINSGLHVDVEDNGAIIYRIKQEDGRVVPVFAYTDFLQYPPVHRLKVVGERGRIEVDFNKATIVVFVDGEETINEKYDDFVRNNMFIEELEEFLECIKTHTEPSSTYEQGIVGLKMALAAKQSSKECREVKLEEI